MVEHKVAPHALTEQSQTRIDVSKLNVFKEALHVIQQGFVVRNQQPATGAVSMTEQVKRVNMDSATGEPACHFLVSARMIPQAMDQSQHRYGLPIIQKLPGRTPRTNKPLTTAKTTLLLAGNDR